jgi:hypothetical protein
LDARNDVPLAAARGAIAHAEFCRKAGLLNQAAEAANEALKLYWQVGGPLANSSERALNIELAVRREIGEQAQLFAVYQTAIHEFDVKLGLTHPRTVAEVRDFARTLLSANRWDEADKLCGDWLKRVRAPNGVLPLECEGILRAQAEVLRRGTDLERAESVCRELAALLERHRPNDLQHYVDLSNLAEILIKRHKFGVAGEVAERAIKGLDTYPAGDPALTRQHLQRARDRLQRAHDGVLQPPS